MRIFFALACFFILSLPGRAATISLSPPPGWQDAAASRSERNLIASFRGPGTSSFVLTRIAPLDIENRGVARAFLLDVLKEIEARTKIGLEPATNLKATVFGNELTAYWIRADIKGNPRLILAATRYKGVLMLGTLISAVPETLLSSFMGAIKADASEPGPSASAVETLDGQLAFLLPPGVVIRSLSARERKLGYVGAFTGMGSDLMLKKVVDEETPLSQQADIVRGTALSVPGARSSSLVPVANMATPAGPELIFCSVRVNTSAGGGNFFAAGYLPWAYWGYSILARGPRAVPLLAALFGRLSPGAAAVPKLVAATRNAPLPRNSGRGLRLLLAALCVLLAAGFLAWRKAAK